VPDANLHRLLRSRQHKLISYQYQSPARNIDPSSHLLPSGDELACVTTLSVFSQCLDDYKQAGSILKHLPRVTSLAVTHSRLFPGIADIGNVGHTIVETVFRAAHDQRGVLKLAALRFDGIHLGSAGSPLQCFVVLEAIQHLQLLYCEDIETFLKFISQKCSSLQTFALEHCQLCRDKDTINNFLRATSLRRLVLRMSNEPFPTRGRDLVAFDALLPFAHAIRCLILDDETRGYLSSEPPRESGASTDVQGLCKSLQSLQQLSIASPTIEKIHWANCGFLDLVVCTQMFCGYNPFTTEQCHRST